MSDKFCPRCRATKPISEFPLSPKARGGGRYGYCKTCKAEYMRDLNDKKREDGRMAQENLTRLLRTYGVDQEWWEERLRRQNGGCLICGGGATGNHKRLVIDHNHETGRARGVLCGDCNQSLGKFKDNPALLRRAALYLEQEGEIRWDME